MRTVVTDTSPGTATCSSPPTTATARTPSTACARRREAPRRTARARPGGLGPGRAHHGEHRRAGRGGRAPAPGHPARGRPRPPVGRQARRRRALPGHPARPGQAHPGARQREHARRRVPLAAGVGLRRDRPDGPRGRPRLRRQPPDLHLPGRHDGGGGHDVRVVSWTLDKGPRRRRKPTVLVSGFPTSTGRHGGCRLLVASDGSLYVGTGDAAVGTNPQDLTSLGGKVLRLDPTTGEPLAGNPLSPPPTPGALLPTATATCRASPSARRRHGVARSSTAPTATTRSTAWSAGGDYGWDPSRAAARATTSRCR